MENQILLKEINEQLRKAFGTSQDGRPNWRLIWSDSELATEMRRGVYNRFSDQNFERFQREESGVFREKKYPWIGSRYLLEQLVYEPRPDVPESKNGNYELRYVTQDGAGNYLPPKWEVYEAFITFASGRRTRLKIDWQAYFQRESDDYKGWVKNVAEENFPFISHQIKAGEASFVPSSYPGKENVLKEKESK